jgi:hypothetical protein
VAAIAEGSRVRRTVMRHRAVFAAALVIAFLIAPLLPPPASADEVFRHSGSIVAIADDATTFVLAEVGPWQVRDGETVVTYRTVTLLPETRYAIVGRVEEGPSGFPGEFVEVEVGPDLVYLNDYVTVECRHEGPRMLALKITVTELAGR